METILIPLDFTVDLDKDTREMALTEPFVQSGNTAHRITLTLKRGAASANLPGASAYCYVVLSNLQTVVVQGAVSGNTVTVTLNSDCYAVQGWVRILVRLSVGAVIETPLYLTGSILSDTTDTMIDSDDIVPSLTDLLAQITALEEAKANAVASADASAFAGNPVANAASAGLDEPGAGIAMQPMAAAAVGPTAQTVSGTTLHLDLPQWQITNATLFMNDSDLSLWMRVPVLPEIGIDYAANDTTTELYQLVHGY